MSELRGHDAWKTREPQPDATGDDRPTGYGICRLCGRDCDEQDYDSVTRESICGRCWQARQDTRMSA